jgi:hypothetical protein
MRSIKYIPEICKGESPKFSGDITVKAFTFDEKFEYIQSLDVDVSSDGSVNVGNSNNIEKTRRMVKLSQKYYISVDLKNNATGEEIKSFEDMSYCEELHECLIEIAAKMLSGFKLGNG